MKRALSFLLMAATIGTALAISCSDAAIVPYCTGIPAHGCPYGDPQMVDGGSNCSDTTCEALYAPDSNCDWTLVKKCAGYVAAVDGGVRDAADAGDASSVFRPDGPIRDAGFDVPPGAWGGGDACTELESPDCPLGEALACGTTCCGCETLYVCGDGGWNVWGECDEAGAPVPASP
jgi:hypothetical protein